MKEGFNFVNTRRRFSNASDFLILEAFKDLSKSARAIANEFKSSDSHVLKVFDKYVNMESLPLTAAICIDEVHMEMDIGLHHLDIIVKILCNMQIINFIMMQLM